MSDAVDTEISNHKSRSVPPGYKQTEVGVIPEDWEVSQLGALAETRDLKQGMMQELLTGKTRLV